MNMITKSGRFVDPWHVKVEDVSLADIAYSLSRQVRFTGHCDLNVASHSISVRRALQRLGHDTNVQACGLFHDAAETWLHDISVPVKHDTKFDEEGRYEEAHSIAENAVMEKYRIQTTHSQRNAVRRIDKAVAATELWNLWPECRERLEAEYPGTAALVIPWLMIETHSAKTAEALFLSHARELQCE